MLTTSDFNGFKGAAKRLEDRDIPWIGSEIGVGEDELRAFMDVESRKQGFDSQNRPTILFEPHKFWHNLPTDKRDAARAARLAAPRWGMIPYGKYSEQYDRLIAAMAFDADAALKSASWGLCQILGENHRMVGYNTIEEFVRSMMEDEENHLKACVRFIKAAGIDDDLRAHRWDVVARVYNGPGYKKNGYDKKLANRFAFWKSRPDFQSDGSIVHAAFADREPVALLKHLTNKEVEQIQKRLRDLNYFEVGKIDGLWGTRTIGAIAAFQAHEGLPVNANNTPILDADTQQRLAVAQPRDVAAERKHTTANDLRAQQSDTVRQADKINFAQWGQFGMAVLECIVLAWNNYPSTSIGPLATVTALFGTPAWLVPLVQFVFAFYTRAKSNSVIMARLNSERSGLHNGEPDPAPSPPTVYAPEPNQGLGINKGRASLLDVVVGPR